jgi:DNA polymerase-3 subunit epsilon
MTTRAEHIAWTKARAMEYVNAGDPGTALMSLNSDLRKEGPMCGFDVESSGVNVWSDRILTACIVQIRSGRRPEIYRWTLNPGPDFVIPPEAAAINGLTIEQLQTEGIDPSQALFEISGMLSLTMGQGIPVVAFNAAFDFTILEAENARHRVPTLAARLAPKKIAPIADVHVLDKAMSRRKGSRKLVDVCKHYGVLLSADGAHDASTDALAACRLFPRILAKYPELQSYPLAHLHQMQVKWRAEQCKSLRQYFDRMGKPHDGVPGDWPVQDPPAETMEAAS